MRFLFVPRGAATLSMVAALSASLSSCFLESAGCSDGGICAVVPDAGPSIDGGEEPFDADAPPEPDSGVADVGPLSRDGGVSDSGGDPPDIGGLPDAGDQLDGGGPSDSGRAPDAGNPLDAGSGPDAGAGGTSVSAGNVSGTWTTAQSPYRVNGHITVPLGSTLTIEPGVVVRFTGKYKFIVYGSILAVGTPTQRIVFTTTSPSIQWWGFLVDHCITHGTGICSNSTPHPAKFAYAIFERARKDDPSDRYWYAGGGLQYFGRGAQSDNDLEITNSIFRDNYAIDGDGALHMVGDKSLIMGCLFIRNSTATLGSAVGWEHSAARLLNCTLTNNSGIGVFDEFDSQGAMVEKNNIIYNNHDPVRGLGDASVWWNMSTVLSNSNSYGTLPLDSSDLAGVDPKFVNAASDDYELQPGSPAADQSVSVNALLVSGEVLPTTDLNGGSRTCGTGEDLGAYEICN